MNPWLIAYTLIYTPLGLAGVWSDIKSRYSWWIIITDSLVVLIGLAGLVLTFLKLYFAWWAPFFAVLVVGSIFVASVDLYDLWQEEEQAQWLTVYSLLGLVFEIPCWIWNYQVAFLTG